MLSPAPIREQSLLVPEPDPAASDPRSLAGGLPLSFYWEILKRYRAWIGTFVLLVTTAVVLITAAMPKIYQSTVLLRVDPSSSRVVGDTSQGNAAQVEANMLVATEGQVITSPAVVVQTIKDLNLGAVPEFHKAAALPQPPGEQNLLVSGTLLQAVRKRITVNQPIETLLLQIGFRAHSPQLAANVANQLAQSFLEHEYTTRAKALTDSTRYMSSQVDTMRAQMERDESALVTYESQHNLVDPDSKENIFEARLQQINADFTKTQAARMSLQADYDISQSQIPDAILATPRGVVLRPLEEKLLGDERELSHLSSIYGPHHPLYQQQAALVATDEGQLRSREQHVANQIRIEYVASLQRERLLEAALEQQKTAMDAFNMRAVKFKALQAEAKSSASLYNDLMQRIQDATVAAGLRSEDLRIISPARPSSVPVSPRPLLDGFLALVIATLVGVGAAIGYGLSDRTISSVEQAEALLRRPVIAALPLVDKRTQPSLQAVEVAGGKVAEHANPQNRPYREAILSLQSTLQLGLPSTTASVAVTSSVPGEGKSTTACHLASAFAEMGARVVIVDADMRKPSIHRLFGLPNQRGLSLVLDGRQSLAQATVSLSPNLSVVTAGPSTTHSVELLRRGLGDVIEQLKADYQYVFIDCPPLLGFADAFIAANLADTTLMVVMAGATDQRWVHAALRALRAGRVQLQGVILNRVNARGGGEYSYYYHSHYYSDSTEPEPVEEED